MAQQKEALAQPPANLPTGDDDFAKAEMQAAMQRALEKAGEKSVADIPTVEAPPPPELPPDVEVDTEVMTPDKVDEYVEAVGSNEYYPLAAEIRKFRTAKYAHLEPERDIPKEWGAAKAAYSNLQELARKYRQETDTAKIEELFDGLKQGGSKEFWQRIWNDASAALEKLQAEPIPDVSVEVSAKAEAPVPEALPVEAPLPIAPVVTAPEVAPPVVTEKKKKRVPVKGRVASIAASTPTSAEAPELTPEREALARAVKAVTSKAPETGAKLTEGTKKEAFNPKALLKNINRRYDELVQEMNAKRIEPAEVLFAMRPVSAIEARLQIALDARKATKNPAARAVAEREARAAYDELMGPATMAVHEAIGRKRASHDALESSEVEGAPAKTPEAGARAAESIEEVFDAQARLEQAHDVFMKLGQDIRALNIPMESYIGSDLERMSSDNSIAYMNLSSVIDRWRAATDPVEKKTAEKEAQDLYEDLVGPRAVAERAAIEAARATGGAAAKTPSGGPKPEEIQLEEPPAETLESSPVPPSSAAALMFARPAGSIPATEQMPHIDERVKVVREKLAARSAELDKKAEGLGPVAERLVRSIGERYNRLSWKQKLLVGGALAAGAVGASVATGGASIWWTFGILSGYRAVAGAGAFIVLEGALQHAKEKGDHWWNRHPKAYAATAGALIASGLVGKGVGLVAETSGASGWLKAHWPFGSGTPNHPAPAVKTPSGIPIGPSVEVKPGYGYESMVRELTGQLQGQDPSLYPEGSDAYRLLNATPERFNSVILQIEKEHGFVKPDGSSAVVGLGSRMSLDAQGMLASENTLAPRGTVAAPEAPRAGATVASPIERGPTATDLNRQELSRIQAGLPPEPTASQLNAQELARISASQAQSIPESIPTSYPNAPFVNHFNVPIDPTQGGVYQGPNNAPIAFANDPARAMATAEEWARGHHRVPIWVQAPEPYMDQGVPRSYAIPVEHRGFFGGGMHHGTLPPNTPPPKDWMGVMNPNTFTKRLS